MKQRLFPRLAALAAACLLLTACGAGASTSSSSVQQRNYAAAPAEPSYAPTVKAELGEDGTGLALPQLPQDGRKRVQHVDLQLESLTFDTALAQLQEAITRSGGYLAGQQVSGRSFYTHEEYYQRTATLNARIPAEQMSGLVEEIGAICNITSTQTSVEDITDRYVDLETRLTSLRLQEERLLELLTRSGTLEELLTIESRLSEVRYQIESLTGQQQKMDHQVTYSYLNLTLDEVVEYRQSQRQPATFGEKLTASLHRSGRNIASVLEHLLFFLIEQGPIFAILLLLVVLLLWVVRKLLSLWGRRHPSAPRPPRRNGWNYPAVPQQPSAPDTAPQQPDTKGPTDSSL